MPYFEKVFILNDVINDKHSKEYVAQYGLYVLTGFTFKKLIS